jgi:trans-aconitate 2-methyltransferase
VFQDLRFPPDTRVLDIGCGPASFALWASRQAPQGFVLAVDIDPRVVEWAKQQYPPSQYPNLAFMEADACKLEFEAEPFDFVTSNACLHYLDHPGKAFAAAARHLKPGGRLCVICLGQGNLMNLHKAFRKVMKSADWAPHFREYKEFGSLADPASCVPWLEKAGLVKKQARLANEPVTFAHRRFFQEWVNSNFTFYWECLPLDMRERFLNEVVSFYCRGQGPDEPVRAFRVWLQLEAVKTGDF